LIGIKLGLVVGLRVRFILGDIDGDMEEKLDIFEG
jgi:hypothetical protein